jgi:hypothetical protein
MRLSWPRDKDKKRAIVADSPPELLNLSRRSNIFVNTTSQDMEVYRDIILRVQPHPLIRSIPKLWMQPQPFSKYTDLIQHCKSIMRRHVCCVMCNVAYYGHPILISSRHCLSIIGHIYYRQCPDSRCSYTHGPGPRLRPRPRSLLCIALFFFAPPQRAPPGGYSTQDISTPVSFRSSGRGAVEPRRSCSACSCINASQRL